MKNKLYLLTLSLVIFSLLLSSFASALSWDQVENYIDNNTEYDNQDRPYVTVTIEQAKTLKRDLLFNGDNLSAIPLGWYYHKGTERLYINVTERQVNDYLLRQEHKKNLVFEDVSNKKVFSVTSTADIYQINTIESSQEWGYFGNETETDIVTSDYPLVSQSGDYICTNPSLDIQQSCIYYPAQWESHTENIYNSESEQFEDVIITENVRTITRLNDYTYQVTFKNMYDPTLLDLSSPEIVSTSLNSDVSEVENSTDLTLDYYANGKNIVTDWRKDNVSLAVLNMPFALNSSTVAKDYSTSSINGPVTGANWLSDRGGSYEFDGVNNEIIISSDFNIDYSSFSILFWIKTTDNSNQRPLGIRGCGGSGFSIFGSTNLDFFVDNGIVSDTIQIINNTYSDGNFHFLTILVDRDSNLISTYNDGNFYRQIHTSLTGDFTGGNDALRIGAGDSCPNYFNGSIDDVMIFNYSLSDEEITALYNAGLENKSLETFPSEATSINDTFNVNVTVTNYLTEDSLLTNTVTIIADIPVSPVVTLEEEGLNSDILSVKDIFLIASGMLSLIIIGFMFPDIIRLLSFKGSSSILNKRILIMFLMLLVIGAVTAIAFVILNMLAAA